MHTSNTPAPSRLLQARACCRRKHCYSFSSCIPLTRPQHLVCSRRGARLKGPSSRDEGKPRPGTASLAPASVTGVLNVPRRGPRPCEAPSPRHCKEPNPRADPCPHSGGAHQVSPSQIRAYHPSLLIRDYHPYLFSKSIFRGASENRPSSEQRNTPAKPLRLSGDRRPALPPLPRSPPGDEDRAARIVHCLCNLRPKANMNPQHPFLLSPFAFSCSLRSCV